MQRLCVGGSHASLPIAILAHPVASILHLVDQWRWGLISWASLIDLSQYTLSYIAQRYRLDSCELSISREEATRYELLLDELRQLLLPAPRSGVWTSIDITN